MANASTGGRAPAPAPPPTEASSAAEEMTAVLPPNATVKQWGKLYFADRRARGYSSVRQDESRWDTWIVPEIGDETMTTFDEEAAERVVAIIDEAQREGEILPKTESLIWGVLTAACAEACESKNRQLRVHGRKTNPTTHVRGPDSGAERACRWIYASEADRLPACDRVPMRWREVYALVIYLVLRPGELEALTPEACDFIGTSSSSTRRPTARRKAGTRAR